MKRTELHFEESAFDDFKGGELDRIELPPARGIFLVLGLCGIALSVLIAGRVTFLNITRGEYYEGRAETNVYKEERTPADRGIITDRFGEPLATNRGTFSVILDVKDIIRNRSALTTITRTIGETLDIQEEELRETLLSFDYEQGNAVVLVRDLTPQEVIKIEGLDLPGIRIEDDYVRNYPDTTTSHIVGYTGLSETKNIVEGKTGLEAYYDEYLRGKDGITVYYQDAHGSDFGEKSFLEPIPGKNLETTIDAELQRYFDQRLKSGLRALGRETGVGIAMDPRTGEVLSLVSIPGYDANIFVDRRRSDERAALLHDPNKALFNRVVSGTYSPGSTIKPLMALAALRENVITPDTNVFSRGFIEIPNPYAPDEPSRFLDWAKHGLVNLASALARSSNVYFYAVGGGLPAEETGTRAIEGLGIEKIKKYWQKLGFGAPTGIDLPSESVGFLPDPEWKEREKDDIWRIGDTFNISIGQGDLLVSPLQLITFFASIANGGTLFVPYIAKDKGPTKIGDYTDWYAEIEDVRAGLNDAVEKPYGTAHRLANLPMKVAGKTGSAQTNNNTRENAFFIGYAPADHPQIVILILVEHAREGSINTLPIARDVLEWYYHNRIIMPTRIYE